MITATGILGDTDWAGLQHAHGSAADLPRQLEALLSEDTQRAGEAVRTLYGSVLHQGSIYAATAPAARFVAAVLPDPRVAIPYQGPEDSEARPLRAHLIEWLDDVASSAYEASGWDEPGIAECLELFPELRRAVAAHLGDPDESVRDAAEVFLETTETDE